MKPSMTIAVASAMLTLGQLASAQGVSTCPAQNVFDQCKKDQDNYLKTCTQSDYACLCKWQTTKVSCWNTCPNDNQKGIEESLMITYCSQPGANVTTPSSASVIPPPSSAAPSQEPSSSTSATPSTTPHSAASGYFVDKGAMLLAAASALAISQFFL